MNKTITLIFAMIIGVVFASPIKRNIAAMNIEQINEEKASYTASDYIQDGLCVMWDGIENVGWGTHDANSLEWVDLVGGSPSLVLKSQTYFSENALVRQGKDGRISGYPNIDWSNPLSERTLEFVMSAENLPENITTTNYYFFAMQSNGGVNRILWTGTNPRVVLTLRAAGGVKNTNISIDNVIYPNTFSLVGTSEAYSDTRNYANYYCNGEFLKGVSIFGGDPISTPRFNIFADTRAWPEENTIRIHCIRFYNRQLSEDEIRHNRKIDKERFGL